MGPLRLGRIRGDRIADMNVTPACGVAETSSDTGSPGACRRAFVNPS